MADLEVNEAEQSASSEPSQSLQNNLKVLRQDFDAPKQLIHSFERRILSLEDEFREEKVSRETLNTTIKENDRLRQELSRERSAHTKFANTTNERINRLQQELEREKTAHNQLAQSSEQHINENDRLRQELSKRTAAHTNLVSTLNNGLDRFLQDFQAATEESELEAPVDQILNGRYRGHTGVRTGVRIHKKPELEAPVNQIPNERQRENTGNRVYNRPALQPAKSLDTIANDEQWIDVEELLSSPKKRRNVSSRGQPPAQKPRLHPSIKIWVDEKGDLVTDSLHKDATWELLETKWKSQIIEMEQRTRNWMNLDLENKCLWTMACSPRTQIWTNRNPSKFACKVCANTLRICFARVGEDFQALPLPALEGHEVVDMADMFIVKTANVSRRHPGIWP